MDAKLAKLQEANEAARTLAVYARDMMRAQGARLTGDQMAILVRQADALRAVLETSEPQTVRVNVYDIYSQNMKIGELEFTA